MRRRSNGSHRRHIERVRELMFGALMALFWVWVAGPPSPEQWNARMLWFFGLLVAVWLLDEVVTYCWPEQPRGENAAAQKRS